MACTTTYKGFTIPDLDAAPGDGAQAVNAGFKSLSDGVSSLQATKYLSPVPINANEAADNSRTVFTFTVGASPQVVAGNVQVYCDGVLLTVAGGNLVSIGVVTTTVTVTFVSGALTTPPTDAVVQILLIPNS